jgi:hypothetical protein
MPNIDHLILAHKEDGSMDVGIFIKDNTLDLASVPFMLDIPWADNFRYKAQRGKKLKVINMDVLNYQEKMSKILTILIF